MAEAEKILMAENFWTLFNFIYYGSNGESNPGFAQVV